MTNEFGAVLDRAGYAPSILQAAGKSCCYLCGKPAGGEKMDRHEPWNGANRRKSMELGLWVNLHHFGCHEGPGSVHDQPAKAREMRADVQRAAMMRYGWSYAEWLRRFGKSEISEEEADKLLVVANVVKKAADGAPVEVDIAADGRETDTSADAARHLPLKGKANSTSSGAARDLPLKVKADMDKPGSGTSSRVAALIHEFWPEHQTTFRAAGFREINGPDLPF